MKCFRQMLTGSLVFALSASVNAVPIEQYADTVISFSSQYATTVWSAEQVLGEPDTLIYGDIVTAWAPSSRNGTLESITLGFETAVYSDGAIIRETYGNGFVYQVDVLDMDDMLHTVWSGVDTSLPGTPVDFQINWEATDFLTHGLRIYTDTNLDLYAWEEIDSVLLQGDTRRPVEVDEPGTLALLGLGIAGIGFASRKKTA